MITCYHKNGRKEFLRHAVACAIAIKGKRQSTPEVSPE